MEIRDRVGWKTNPSIQGLESCNSGIAINHISSLLMPIRYGRQRSYSSTINSLGGHTKTAVDRNTPHFGFEFQRNTVLQCCVASLGGIRTFDPRSC